MKTRTRNCNRRRTSISEAAILILCTCAGWNQVKSETKALNSAKVFPNVLGVNIAGAEFGTDKPIFSAASPGAFGHDYIYPGRDTIDPLAKQGIRLFRIPVRWERLQPKLNQPLNSDELGRLITLIERIGRANSVAIIDLHNYGRYRSETDHVPLEAVIDQFNGKSVAVSANQLADFWRRIALQFKEDNVVVGYGMMNEPHDMGRSSWSRISQITVDAIRAVDRRTWILVGGNDWSSAERFESANGPRAWINDPTDLIIYEAHCYLDHDGSGKYSKSFEREQQLDPTIISRPQNRLKPFVLWCQRNRVRGFVGEFGVPADDPAWNRLLDEMLTYMADSQLQGCCWAAGPWWGDYPLSIESIKVNGRHLLSLDLLRKHQNGL